MNAGGDILKRGNIWQRACSRYCVLFNLLNGPPMRLFLSTGHEVDFTACSKLQRMSWKIRVLLTSVGISYVRRACLLKLKIRVLTIFNHVQYICGVIRKFCLS
jgi:hypothetical protein